MFICVYDYSHVTANPLMPYKVFVLPWKEIEVTFLNTGKGWEFECKISYIYL